MDSISKSGRRLLRLAVSFEPVLLPLEYQKCRPLKDGYFEMTLPRALFEGSKRKSITLNYLVVRAKIYLCSLPPVFSVTFSCVHCDRDTVQWKLLGVTAGQSAPAGGFPAMRGMVH